jgi:hypothetical protein
MTAPPAPYIPERRLYETTLELRDTQLVGKPYKFLEGRAVPFLTWAQVSYFYLEQHDIGSLDQSTKAGTGKGLPLLLFHNSRSFPIGISDSWSSQDDGLHGTWRLNDTTEAQQAARLADEGQFGMSIGFAPIRSDWTYVEDFNPDLGHDHMDRVTRQESRLLEVSLTPTPAFIEAEVTMVRTAERARQISKSKADGWRRELDRLKAEAPHAG